MTLTAERARELLDYDPETGVLTWKVAVGTKIKPGMHAATRPNKSGHLVMKIVRRNYFQHRVAWLIAHGRWPEHTIDHINQNPADNRLCNLRDVTHADNLGTGEGPLWVSAGSETGGERKSTASTLVRSQPGRKLLRRTTAHRLQKMQHTTKGRY